MNTTTAAVAADLDAAYTVPDRPDRPDPRWRLKAECAEIPNPDIFFAPPRVAGHRQALALCRQCPVRSECLQDAVECGVRDGIRGGHMEDQLDEMVTYHEDRRLDLDRVRTTLTSTQRPRLSEREKRAVVRVAIEAGIPLAVWSEALGIGYKAAAKRRSRANTQLESIPASMRHQEITLSKELRKVPTTRLAVAA
ncbi:WhiB family transcriptional regulator [Kitasatospora sp. NPDC001603]|uniref:WhiB family transcriptional regulator n=1 Tax=Kitasatospora sp. NPDC001603 TaxID=3154388 RepID=UPI00332F1A89